MQSCPTLLLGREDLQGLIRSPWWFPWFPGQEVLQASAGFYPFELLLARKPQGVLDQLEKKRLGGTKPELKWNSIYHRPESKCSHTGKIVTGKLHNREIRLRHFTPGIKVLVLLTSSSSKLLAKWQGSLVVTRSMAMSIKRWCLLTGVEPNKYTTSTSWRQGDRSNLTFSIPHNNHRLLNLPWHGHKPICLDCYDSKC